MSQQYLVVADPTEAPVSVDAAYDAVICTGDILDLAPPPGADPEGSLLAAHRPGVSDRYTEDDVAGILDDIRDAVNDTALHKHAAGRYQAFFDKLDRPFYYVTGNQDLPDALASAASNYETVQPVSTVDDWTGVDGVIPSVAGIPEGVFPVECSEDAFYDQLEGGELLVAHTLPDGFDPGRYGYRRAVASAPDGAATREADGVIELAPWPDAYRIIEL